MLHKTIVSALFLFSGCLVAMGPSSSMHSSQQPNGFLLHLKALDISDVIMSEPEGTVEKACGCLGENKIEELSFATFNLLRVPDLIFSFIKLKRLDLSGNRLASIPAAIGNLVNLEELNLAGREKVVGNYGHSSHVAYFDDLENHRLQSLPQEISNLKKLRTLDISNNFFQDILFSFICYYLKDSNLQELDVSGNELGVVPSQIGYLKDLRTLDFSNNIGLRGTWRDRCIESLPESFKQLTKLEYIGLRDMWMSGIGGSLSVLSALVHNKKLKIIDLRCNVNFKIPKSFTNFPSLKKLMLPKNTMGTTWFDTTLHHDVRLALRAQGCAITGYNATRFREKIKRSLSLPQQNPFYNVGALISRAIGPLAILRINRNGYTPIDSQNVPAHVDDPDALLLQTTATTSNSSFTDSSCVSTVVRRRSHHSDQSQS